ncbi:MAG: GspH/FimT family pseudopilin [Rubrivivax sp.]|nr:GspH/FimT family pseudopilin [Rubrivivax sp.]
MSRTARATPLAATYLPTASRRATRRPRRGVTLVESLICMTMAAVTLGAVLPGFGGALERRRVEGAAAQLETDLQLTRSLAVAQNRTLRFEIAANEHGSCYIVHDGSAGDCDCAPHGATCTAGVQAHRIAHYPADAGVAVAANVRSMVFEPLRGTVTPTGTLRVTGGSFAVHQVVNLMGRVRSCSPGGSMPGVPAC